MDIFGKALLDYLNGEKNDFFFNVGGENFKHNIQRYFRKSNKLNKSEEMIIKMSYGNILDIGCGTGNYMQKLNKRGYVIGIDNSENVIKVANLLGNKNCVLGDIFNFNSKNKFDTITLFENNIGLGGSIEKTIELLKIIKKLLNEYGQVLGTISKRSGNNDYLVVNLLPIYKGKEGQTFNWININPKYLKGLCKSLGLHFELISTNRYFYVYRITKL